MCDTTSTRAPTFRNLKHINGSASRTLPKWTNLPPKQITQTIDAELAKKGLTKTDADNADLYVTYQTAIDKEKQLDAYNTGWGYGPGWGPSWYGYGGGMSTSTAHDDLHGDTRSGYVRRREQDTGLARNGNEGTKPNFESREAAEELDQRRPQVAEELPF
jgi:hypothetical protein